MPERPDSRFYFAAERTFLSWVRTGLALMAFGVVVARFGVLVRELSVSGHRAPGRGALSLWFGVAFVGLGVAANIAAAIQYVRRLRRFNAGDLSAGTRPAFGVALAVALAVVGLTTAAYLLVYG